MDDDFVEHAISRTPPLGHGHKPASRFFPRASNESKKTCLRLSPHLSEANQLSGGFLYTSDLGFSGEEK